MVNPRIEELLDAAGSKFTLVTLGATRARQINAYFNKLGDGQGGIPPQVASVARKPLSIAFEEISEGLIVPTFEPEEEADAEAGEAAPDGEQG
jgi:DNA-directed RNA polymerase subunit omega